MNNKLLFKVTRTTLTFIILVFMSLTAFSQSLSGDTWAEVKTKKTGQVTISYIETPGLVYTDAKGAVSGIAVDIINDFFLYLEKKEGVKVTVKFEKNNDFKTFYSSVKNGSGGVFGLGNVIISDARKKEVAFSPSFLTNLPRLITHNSVETLKDYKTISTSFEFMKAYTTKGTVDEKRILEIKSGLYPKVTVMPTSSTAETIQKIADDENSFAYVDIMYFMDAVKRNLPIKRHPAGDKPAEDFGIAFPLSTDWNDMIKEFFDANGGYKNSTSYKKIIAKHMGISGAKFLETAQKGSI